MLMVVDARCWCQRNKSPAVVSLQPVRVDHILSPVRPSVRLSVCLVPICGGSTAARTGRPFRLSWLAIFDRPSPFQNPVFANARCGESRALKRVRCTTLHTMVDTPTRGLQQSSRKLVNSRISTTNRALVVCLCGYLETSRNEKNGKSNEYKTQIGIGLLENQTLVQKPSKL